MKKIILGVAAVAALTLYPTQVSGAIGEGSPHHGLSTFGAFEVALGLVGIALVLYVLFRRKVL
jgi:hypothetical protein